MKKKFLSAKGIAFMSIIPILFLSLSFTGIPQSKKANKMEVIHTFLVKIPSTAGVCPYELMMMTKGKLQMADDPQCVCPYQHNTSSHNAIYMTAKCTDVNSVRALLPACIKDAAEIHSMDKTKAELPQKLFTSLTK